MDKGGILVSLQKKIFRSSLSYPPEEVSSVLKNKIEEENQIVEKNSTIDLIEFEKQLLSNIHYKSNQINVVSLFSGAGGLDLGVELASMAATLGEQEAYRILHDKQEFENSLSKVNIVYSNDLFKSANQTYVQNFSSDLVKDSRDIRKVINFPKSDLMLGGFPCPGFSAAGPRLLDDPRNFLYIHYIRALMKSQPTFFIAENVKGLMTMAKGQVLKQMTEDFAAAGYQVSAHLVNARDYGVPQNRERVFIIGVRNDIVERFGFEYILPLPTHGTIETPFKTLHDAIGDLPLEATDVFESSYSSMYMSRNRKKTWNDQSFTIQASGRQAPQHPAGEPMEHIGRDLWAFRGDFNRRLSVRECARIQTFPDWFTFSNGNNLNVSKNNLLNEQYKQIGNAVPVLLAEKMSRPIMKFLIENKELF
ncbi:TPA: DNA cytosine methyltransferase [Enterococcus faecalis]|nr:DNA cytosine methyltransferase [Enterococcus faecalis]KII40559.1 restriction endonuclease BsuRI [Enterococcus faecalis]HBI2113484.1 DNA cytosine methyltransferase [Enterococcus faecalis]